MGRLTASETCLVVQPGCVCVLLVSGGKDQRCQPSYRTPHVSEEKLNGCEDLQDLLELTPPKGVLFIIEDWNAKVGSQEIPGVTQIRPWSTE